MRELGSAQPTAVELEILRILWDLGPSTVRDVHLRLKTANAGASRWTPISVMVSSLIILVAMSSLSWQVGAQTFTEHAPDSAIALGNKPLAPMILLPDFVNVMAVGFSADSRTLTSVATKGDVTIRTWDIAEKKLVREVKFDTKVEANTEPIYEIQFLNGGLGLSQDSKRLIASTNGKVRLWNTEDGKLLQTLPNPVRDGQLIASRGLTSTPDFKIIAAALGASGFRTNNAACEIAIWQGEGYGRIKRLSHPAAVQITSLALSADGSRLASGSQTASTCVFDLAAGRLLYTLSNSNGDRKHPDPEVTETGANQVLCLAFSPDGKQLAIGDLLGVKIVNAANGDLIHAIESSFRFGMSGLRRPGDSEWGPKYGVWKAPEGYVDLGGEVDIKLPLGTSSVEHVFKLRRVEKNSK